MVGRNQINIQKSNSICVFMSALLVVVVVVVFVVVVVETVQCRKRQCNAERDSAMQKQAVDCTVARPKAAAASLAFSGQPPRVLTLI